MPSASLHVRVLPFLTALAFAPACTGAINGAGEPGASGPNNPTPGAPGSPSNPGTPGGSNPTPGGQQPGTSPPPPPSACALPPRRIWKLTPEQYARSVEAVLPIAMPGSGDKIAASLADSGGFSNSADALAMTGPHVTQLLKSSFDLATAAADAPDKVVSCLPAGAKDAACLRTLVTTYGPRAFRRDLTDTEVTALTAFVRAQIDGGDLRAGLQQFFLYLFSSPHFLYRTELGAEGSTGRVSLTAFEKAAALSYFLADGPPDAELMAAARSGALNDKAGIESHTRRLLATPEKAPGLLKFVREALSTQLVLAARKDAMVFPTWTDALGKDLALEAESFIRHVLWQGGGKLSTLLTADYSLVNQQLSGYYGLTGGSADFQKRALPPGQRAGLFTQGAWLAAKADDADTAPVRRGLFLREAVLCGKVPDPPATVNAVPPQPDGKRTQRQRLASHSVDPSCAGCHTLMDPMGLSFERYDGMGRYRTMDVGQSIETAGQINLGSGAKSFTDAVELMKILASAPEVSACFVATAFRYAHGRELQDTAPDDSDRCALDRLKTVFGASGGNIIDLAVALTTDDTFFARQ